MGSPTYSPEEDRQIRTLAEKGWTDAEIAGVLPGRKENGIRQYRQSNGIQSGTWWRAQIAKGRVAPPEPARAFEVADLPSETPSAEELLERRERDFERKEQAKIARRLIPVQVRIDGAFGIMHFGDPHVDDDGTDIRMLRRHVEIATSTPGLLAGNVGDYSNNWVGRLARLYGEQSTSASEAWVLTEWLIRAVTWLYLIGGNHDVWSGAGDPLKWIARQKGALLEPHGARLGLHLPCGRVLRVNARHNWPGHSQWNAAHGVGKAIQMGIRDHVLTNGHTHVSGYMVLKDPGSGLISHGLQIASYKTFDRYAEEKGLKDQTIFVCPVTVFRPEFADDDPRLVTTIFDPETGADYLRWLRAQKGSGGDPPAVALRAA